MQDYNTIIGVIQMRQNNCSSRSIMNRYGIGSGTVALIMNRYKASGLSLQQLQQMMPKDVENTFYPQQVSPHKEVPQPNFQLYYDRIHSPNSRVNISFCWLEYKEAHPDGYEKTQFYELYNRFVKENYGGNKVSR